MIIICHLDRILKGKIIEEKIVKLLRERPNSETFYSRGTF